MDLFVKDKYYNIDSKRDLDVCLKENGFNYDELESMMLSYHAANRVHGVEGLIGDDLYEVQHAINSELSDLENEIKNLNGSSCKGNTRADIANRLDYIYANLMDLNLSCQVYDRDTLEGALYGTGHSCLSC